MSFPKLIQSCPECGCDNNSLRMTKDLEINYHEEGDFWDVRLTCVAHCNSCWAEGTEMKYPFYITNDQNGQKKTKSMVFNEVVHHKAQQEFKVYAINESWNYYKMEKQKKGA